MNTDSSSDRLLRGGALAAMLFMAGALLAVGWGLYRPLPAAAATPSTLSNGIGNAVTDLAVQRSDR